MKITEKMLLDGYEGLTNGLSLLSRVNNVLISWNYRRVNGIFTPVCDYKDAQYIGIEGYHGVNFISISWKNCTHPAVEKLVNDLNDAFSEL